MITFQPFIGGSLGNAPITTTGKITGGSFAAGSVPLPSVVAQTAVGGFALQNAAPNILTWTAPNDGQLHAVIINAVLIVTSLETGGNVIVSYTIGGGAKAVTVLAGGQAAATYPAAWAGFECDPNTSVILSQQTALTAGAASVYAELLAA